MSAIIESLRNGGSSVVGASRDDLQVGDIITLDSVDVATTYGWTMAYQPEGSTATFSGSTVAKSPGTFTVDKEGPYLVRLTVDYGLATESTQYVRLRYLTELGSLKLVAAGENNDGSTPWPIPVDNTPDGWADAQNFNLLTLLGLTKGALASGRITYVDSDPAYGEFDTIQAGIDYAVAQGASFSTPWVVAVRPGEYVEDVVFKPFAHVIAWPGSVPDQNVVRISGTTGHTTLLAAGGETVILRGLSLTSSDPTSTVLTKSGSGEIWIDKCFLHHLSAVGTEGPALAMQAGTAQVYDSYLQGAIGGGLTDRYAFTQSAGITNFYRTQFFGPSGCDFAGGSRATLTDCQVTAVGAAGAYGISSLSSGLTLEYCRVSAVASGDAFLVNPAGTGYAGNVSATLRWTYIGGEIYFDTNGIVGTTNLYVGSCEYTDFNFPTGTPATNEATTKSTSLFYDNTSTGISAENVQDAIDEVHALAVAVQTLDDAYDGGVGGGVGRTIIADAGAVQVVDGAVPSDPPDVDNPNGRIQVVGGVEVGSIDKSEILLDPNPYGNGPFIEMGQAVWPGNAPFGGTSFVLARSTGTPLFRNYNLRIGTQSTDGGGDVGRVIVRGGDGIQSGTTPNAAPVVLQGGSSTDAGVTPGDVVLLPGTVPGTEGSVFVASLAGATGASVTAAGVFVGGVTGIIRFGTDTGAIEVSIAAADNLAAVQGKFNSTGVVTAAGDPITLTTNSLGPGAEIYFLNDDQGGALDTALGQFDGQPMVQGGVSNVVPLTATGGFELTIGLGGPAPLVYNAVTGKLTVPGLIDPTGLNMVQTPDAALPNQTLFVSDGASIPAGHAGYKDDVGVVHDLQVGGGGGFVNPAPEKFVFRPGGVATDNVYTNWATMMAAVGAAAGRKEIVIDPSLGPPTVPVGVWDLTDTVLTDGRLDAPPTEGVGTQTRTPLFFVDGAQITNCHMIANLDINGPATGVTEAVLVDFSPMILLNTALSPGKPAGPPVMRVDRTLQTVYLRCRDSLLTGQGPGVPGINVVNNTRFRITFQGNSQLAADTLQSDALSTFDLAWSNASSVLNLTQPLWAGAFPPIILYYDTAARVDYSNAVSGLVATNVQDAIDEVAGGPGSITVNDEGILVDANTTTLNFTGAGVTASAGAPGTVNVSIPGGGGAASLAATLGVGNQTTGIAIQSDGAGNARGTDALDLQQSRTVATQVASGNNSMVRGINNTASGLRSSACGEGCTASQINAHAEGRNTTASGPHSHAECFGTTAQGFASHAEGLNSTAYGYYSHVEGQSCYANSKASHAEGYFTSAGVYGVNDYGQHSEGRQTQAIGAYSHAEGRQTQAHGEAAHTEGGTSSYGTFAYGDASHAEGENTFAVGDLSHAEGSFSTASGTADHAEGSSYANGGAAHAEGAGCQAISLNAHAEGANTTASAYQAHSEGLLTQATGLRSHAQNRNTIAAGENSHAEGYNAYANALNAHAGGNSSLADIEGQFVRAVDSASTGASPRGTSQWSNFSCRAETSNNFPTNMLPFLVLRDNHAYAFRIMLTGRSRAGAGPGDTAYWYAEGFIKRGVGVASVTFGPAGVLNFAGAGAGAYQTPIDADAGAAAWGGISITANVGNGSLTISVTGLAGETIVWHARIMTSEVGD